MSEELVKRQELIKLQDELTDLRIKLEKYGNSYTTTSERLMSLKSDIERIEAQIDKVTNHMAVFKDNVGEDITTIRENIKRDLNKLYELIKKEFVNKDTFDPIRILVYGLTGIILTAVAYTLVSVAVHLPIDPK